MHYFINTRKGSEFSELVVLDFEKSLSRNGFISARQPSSPRLWDIVGRIAGKMKYAPAHRGTGKPKLLVGMMGLAERQLYPYVLSEQIVPFIWDCWPTRESDWLSFFLRHQFSLIAFTTEDAALFWEPRLPNTKVVWLPEAIDVNVFTAGPPLVERESVLLEIGRRYEREHEVAKRVLATHGAGHLFRESDTSKFLPSRYDLVEALHNNRALLCYPGSVSDPLGRTGAWESMTHRYLEAVATKTLVLGHIPREMSELFGFEPGLNVNEGNFPDALMDLYNDANQFQALVDRAYDRLIEVATWDVRTSQLKEMLVH